MSKYTATLRDLTYYGITKDMLISYFTDYRLEDYLTDEEIRVINSRGTWNKKKLARKIVDHYWMYEIGSETPALFRHRAKVKMQEIMESKLPLIYSSAIKYDPLVNVDYTETYNRNIKGTNEDSAIASGLVVTSNTPQGQISKQSILQGTYASGTSANESSSIGTGTNNTDENYTKKIKGNSGVSATAQKMIEQYRQNIVAIDKDIIEELRPLFMGLF